MVIHVKDPLQPYQADFFTKALNLHALASVSTKALPRDKYTIRTFMPLTGCEPLTGMRSMTCADFTVFSLIFTTSPLVSEVAKYSNGTTGVTAKYAMDKSTLLTAHAKTAGFDPSSSSRIQVDKIVNERGDMFHVAIDTPSLEVPEPILTVGGSTSVAKDTTLITQLWRELPAQGSLFDTLSVGVKYQPCGHMHAGIGADLGFTSKDLNVKNLHSSVYLGTHAGGSLAVLGSLALDRARPHSLRVGGTTQLRIWDKPLPEAIPVDSPPREPTVVIPYPVLGVNYDLVQERTSAFVDLKLLAVPSTEKTARMDLSLKVGMHVMGTNWKEPQLSVHLNAAEM